MRRTELIGAGVALLLLHGCGGGNGGGGGTNPGDSTHLSCTHPAYQTLFQQWAGVATKSEPGIAADTQSANFEVMQIADVARTMTFAGGVMRPVAP